MVIDFVMQSQNVDGRLHARRSLQRPYLFQPQIALQANEANTNR